MSDIDAALSPVLSALAAARRDRQRRLVLLSGSREWGAALIARLLGEARFDDAVWVGEAAPVALPEVTAGKAGTLLGHNLDLVVYDAWAGVHPDGLAAVAGAVNGGGLLVLRAPSLGDWRSFHDPDYQRLLVHPFEPGAIAGRFLRRLIDCLLADPDVCVLEEGQIPAQAPAAPDAVRHTLQSASALHPAATADQQRAIIAIRHVLKGHSRRPLVMTSDRGRGKSSALGIAAAQLLQAGYRCLLITAPRLAAVAPVFYHAARELGLEAPASQVDYLELGAASLRFVAPDELLRHPVDCDLLMVDEAAAIPASLLEDFMRRYNRMVFSTTTHGYEGTGRGFEVRFKPRLRQLANQVREVQLAQPVRWAEGDPVERWLFEALLLDARPAEVHTAESAMARHAVVERVDRDALVRDPDTLRQLFGLLVLAHYQTTPSDLRNLLDGPNVSVWLARCQGQVVAAALVAEEGGFNEGLAQAVWRGERRPRGHLMAQTLSAHAGFQAAPLLRYWRVMRIAVHPQLRRAGAGRAMISAIVDGARRSQLDLLGSSFAATADVLAFWHSVQCVPVRLGTGRDASSGCHSAVVLSALSDSGVDLLEQAQLRFAESFPRALETTFSELDSDLVVELLRTLPLYPGYQMHQQDWLDVQAFATAGRQLADCRLALWKLALRSGMGGELSLLDDTARRVLVSTLIQQRPDKAVCAEFGLTGKKALQKILKQGVARLRQALIAPARCD